jgi:hypothetical protein
MMVNHDRASGFKTAAAAGDDDLGRALAKVRAELASRAANDPGRESALGIPHRVFKPRITAYASRQPAWVGRVGKDRSRDPVPLPGLAVYRFAGEGGTGEQDGSLGGFFDRLWEGATWPDRMFGISLIICSLLLGHWYVRTAHYPVTAAHLYQSHEQVVKKVMTKPVTRDRP